MSDGNINIKVYSDSPGFVPVTSALKQLEIKGFPLNIIFPNDFEVISNDIIILKIETLAAMVKAGRFRSDLYFRVRVVEIELPPLRARGDGDILGLAEHSAAVYDPRHRKATPTLTDDARAALCAHPWPGNVRELEHAIERAVVLARGTVIDARALGLERALVTADGGPAGNGGGNGSGVLLPHELTLEEAERRYAAAALERAGGNQSAAARALGISRNKLARLLRG